MAWLTVLLAGVATLFWYNEWIYSLPTPVPVDYKMVGADEEINVARHLANLSDKPIFLHFFNPDCPCSRFNLPHFRSLVKEYGDKVNFVLVPMVLLGQEYSDKEIQDKVGLPLPVWREPGVAAACGVYSTPQAVVIADNYKLYYRGNYNRSRYCTDKATNYAEIAVASLIANTSRPVFDQMALKAYGCTITGCSK